MVSDQQLKKRKSLQFHISHLLWLVLGTALICAMVRADLLSAVAALILQVVDAGLSLVMICLPFLYACLLFLGIHRAIVWCCPTTESAYWVGRMILRVGFAMAGIVSALIVASLFDLVGR